MFPLQYTKKVWIGRRPYIVTCLAPWLKELFLITDHTKVTMDQLTWPINLINKVARLSQVLMSSYFIPYGTIDETEKYNETKTILLLYITIHFCVIGKLPLCKANWMQRNGIVGTLSISFEMQTKIWKELASASTDKLYFSTRHWYNTWHSVHSTQYFHKALSQKSLR